MQKASNFRFASRNNSLSQKRAQSFVEPSGCQTARNPLILCDQDRVRQIVTRVNNSNSNSVSQSDTEHQKSFE